MVIEVRGEIDVGRARRAAAGLASSAGLDAYGREAVAIAVSEAARNQVEHAGGGRVSLDVVSSGGRRALQVEAADEGPGIADVARALEDGYSTTGSLGSGLPAMQRLMDEFAIESKPGGGTRITMRKWVP